MKKSAPLLPVERQQRILEILREELSVRGSRLSELLGVSEMTIRRDLDALGRQGVVERTHGGAVFRQERVVGRFHYNSAVQENLREKQRIARRAADMIEPNDIIFLGEGTTCAQMIRYVDSGMPFTIFTNNLGVISEIEDKTGDLILLGGAYNHTTRALAGPLTMEMISQVNVTKLFLGVDGFSLNAGLTTPNLEMATVDRSMIRHTRGKVIVMADHSKFGLVAEIVITPIKNIDVLITDRKIPDDFEQDLRSMNVEVVIA
jgi:DeoR family fructose operon transcriptional repressor